MKFSKVLILLVSLVLVCASGSLAQDDQQDGQQGRQSAAQTAVQLRAQLRDVQAREFELQARLQQLEVDLKPENIERYFAAVGSTRPEELREMRRRQLQNEKDSISAQLSQLAMSRTQLESAVLTADAAAYQQSAQLDSAGGLGQTLVSSSFSNSRLVIFALSVITIIGAVALVVVIRRRRRLDRA